MKKVVNLEVYGEVLGPRKGQKKNKGVTWKKKNKHKRVTVREMWVQIQRNRGD